MDVDFCAGGDSTRRKVDLAGVAEGTMDVLPLEMYDSARAKIAANLRWLFAKAYGIDHIPEDLRDPFYTDQYDQEHIKPPVIRLLLSCELYCRVCTLILKTEQAASLKSHQSVIQALSRKGIYVVESDDTPVTEADLACVPIKMIACQRRRKPGQKLKQLCTLPVTSPALPASDVLSYHSEISGRSHCFYPHPAVQSISATGI